MILRDAWKVLGASLLALSACGNSSETVDRRAQVAGVFAPDTRPTIAELRAQIGFVLENTTVAILLVEQPAQDQGAFFAQAAANSGVVTYGSDAQSTISLRGPVVVASRGFGQDLMSADVGPLPELLSARREGSYTRIMRFLDSLDQIQERRFACTLRREDGAMVEYCGSARHEYTNIYRYGAGNEIAVSQQWLGVGNGDLTIRRLR